MVTLADSGEILFVSLLFNKKRNTNVSWKNKLKETKFNSAKNKIFFSFEVKSDDFYNASLICYMQLKDKNFICLFRHQTKLGKY